MTRTINMADKNYKILIVDDDDFLLDMYALKFRESNFDVEVSSRGEEAIEKIRAGLEPDVVILDVVMPPPDGFEVLKILKKEKFLEKMTVIILTNLGQKEDIDKGFHLGASDYIVKAHFTPSEVVSKVKDIISRNKIKS